MAALADDSSHLVLIHLPTEDAVKHFTHIIDELESQPLVPFCPMSALTDNSPDLVHVPTEDTVKCFTHIINERESYPLVPINYGSVP